MYFFNWVDSKIQSFRWYHISMIKLAAAAFVLMLAKLWPPLLSLDWTIYLIIGVVASLPVLSRMCKKR